MWIGLFIPCHIDAFFPEVGRPRFDWLRMAETRMSAVRPRLAEADGAQHVQYLVWGTGAW